MADWRDERRKGVIAIAAAALVTLGIWFTAFRFGLTIAGIDSLSVRMLLALKCVAIATLFCLVGGVEAVAHERLQSPAFDPLTGHETRRLRVNLRYLQNTLEQLIVFTVAIFGLAAYATTEPAVRAVIATTVVWIGGRFAFWLGYHRSAAMRGLGAPGMAAGMLALLYVAWRVGDDVAGSAGGWAMIGAFLFLEEVLFRATRSTGVPE